MPDANFLLFLLVCGMAAIIDVRVFRIPDPLVAAGFLVAIITDGLVGRLSLWTFAEAAAVGGCLLGVRLATRGGLGLGDVKLAALGGYCMGISRAWTMLAFAALVGISAFIVLYRGKMTGRRLPFAPFMVIGSLIAFFLPVRLF